MDKIYYINNSKIADIIEDIESDMPDELLVVSFKGNMFKCMTSGGVNQTLTLGALVRLQNLILDL